MANTPTLLELVYVSNAFPHDFPEQELERILASSRRRNAAIGVTGVLLYRTGTFLQLLEGPADAVRRLYGEIIHHDPRHRALVLCWEQPITTRSFPQWWMGYVDGGTLDAAAGPLEPAWLSRGIAGLDLSGPGSTGRRLLMSLARS
ncbi:MAG: BLUF domain-containing protein [Burkholderiales bacterium]|nr:BLUF domain-containing protein [Burkholderiales bacterium]